MSSIGEEAASSRGLMIKYVKKGSLGVCSVIGYFPFISEGARPPTVW